MGVLPGGLVTIRHGIMKRVDVLDGYSVRSIPEARTGVDADWGSPVPIYALSFEEAWTVAEGALRQYQRGQWTTRAAPLPGRRMLSAVPLNAQRILVLFTDAVEEYDAGSGAWRPLVHARQASLGPFRRMTPAHGVVWVAGAYGLGRIDVAATCRWTAYPASGLTDFDSPLPGGEGEVFAAATRGGAAHHVVVHFRDGRYQAVFASEKPLTGWRGPDQSLWVLEGSRVWRILGGRKQAVERRGPLSGVVYDVSTEAGGGFWIASSTGVAHYSPPVWTTPAPLRSADDLVHDIVETPQGRLWFAATESLLELDGDRWKVHPLPPDFQTETFQTASLTALADGRIAFISLDRDNRDSLMTYDPRRGAFELVKHPRGRTTALAWRKGAGSLWVLTGPPCQIEIWDGKTFTPRPDIRLEPLCSRVRYLIEGRDGSAWVGTTSQAGGVHRPGAPGLELFGKASGYPDLGVYTLFEDVSGRILAGGRDSLAEFDGRRWKLLGPGEMDAVRSILRTRDGALWVASGSGVHRVRDGTWITQGEAEGLPSDIAFKLLEDRRGRIWAATSRGLSLYKPGADRDPPHAILAASNVAEAQAHGNVTLAFSGVDRWNLSLPDRLLFSHRIDEGPWSAFHEGNTAAFRQVPSGSHRFEVRAMDRNGNAGPAESFVFTVAVPWYREAGFLAILVGSLAAIAALLAFAWFQYRQIARAKLAAERANRCKSEFLANMSHEIRTPMNAIVGMSELAAERAEDAEQAERLRIVRTASISLLALLNDILDLSKVEAGKLELIVDDFDLRQCAQDSIRTLEARAQEKKLGLICRIAPDVPQFVRGDALRLRQILLNLLGNSIKFTSEGEVSLSVAVDPGTKESVHLRFRVADTGIGVPADKQDMIFAPFEQADASTTRKFGGTGLGLAISAQLVRLMHGAIWVESPWKDDDDRVRSGSAFHFTLWLSPGSPPKAKPPSAPASFARKLRVLVVEDNAVNQLLATRLIEKLGHSVLVASNGAEAVQTFERESPDLVLMDVQMPVMDGYEATAAIRAAEADAGRRTPIIALTAHALQGDREKCLKAGMDDYLSKPIQPGELVRALTEAASGPPQAQAHG